MHVETIPQQMRLVAPSSTHALKLGLLEVVLQNSFVVGMRTLLDDDLGSLLGTQSSNIRETLFCDDDVKIVLCLVDVRAHGYDAAHAVLIDL